MGVQSYRKTAYGHEQMDGAPPAKKQGIALIAAALANLPASVGGAAFATVEAMPGEFAGTLENPRFNFSDAAATQRALNRKQYQETDVFNRHSDQFQRRFNDLNHEPEHMTRVVRQALLGVPLTQKALEHFIARDVVFPFNMLYFRPYMTYEMSSGVCLKCGAGTGETLVGQSDFQMGDDVQRKVHFGHYTIKYKSVVYNHRAVYHAYNYMCTGYVGGNDTRFVTQASDTQFNKSQDTADFHSMYACLVPYQRKSYCNPMDVTGSFYDSSKNRAVPGDLHYASADFYKNRWQFTNHAQKSSQEPMYTSDRGARNTVVWQGHQAMYNPRTMGFTTVIENTGHWGRNVYPGVGKVRAGLASAINQVSYNDAYGGAAQQSHTTF